MQERRQNHLLALNSFITRYYHSPNLQYDSTSAELFNAKNTDSTNRWPGENPTMEACPDNSVVFTNFKLPCLDQWKVWWKDEETHQNAVMTFGQYLTQTKQGLGAADIDDKFANRALSARTKEFACAMTNPIDSLLKNPHDLAEGFDTAHILRWFGENVGTGTSGRYHRTFRPFPTVKVKLPGVVETTRTRL